MDLINNHKLSQHSNGFRVLVRHFSYSTMETQEGGKTICNRHDPAGPYEKIS